MVKHAINLNDPQSIVDLAIGKLLEQGRPCVQISYGPGYIYPLEALARSQYSLWGVDTYCAVGWLREESRRVDGGASWKKYLRERCDTDDLMEVNCGLVRTHDNAAQEYMKLYDAGASPDWTEILLRHASCNNLKY